MAKKEVRDLKDIQSYAPLRHIAFIMDGNGRWAKKRLMPRSAGHRAGVAKIHEIIDSAFEDYGIYAASLFCFSTENWNRPEDEITTLFRLLKEFFEKEIDYFMEKSTQVRVLGELDDPRIPADTLNTIREAMEKTKNNNRHVFNVLFNYGGRGEILHATKEICQDAMDGKIKVEDINDELFKQHLYTKEISDIDLLIRTSGEERISNCFLYQLAYTELEFIDVYWPSFSKKDLAQCLENYTHRNRRFGAIKE
jgi:undecaprenyl diphosphate synthase